MAIDRRTVLSGAATGVVVGSAGCLSFGESGSGSVADAELTLTTTTSTYDTGLLDELNAGFEERFGARVATVNQGTGAALRSARDGDADVVLVHARALEDEFIRDGYGVNRRDLMFNDFIVVGPASDPANVESTTVATAAFDAIAAAEATFVSRGDDSGTHAMERSLWDDATSDPAGEWYRELGSGMGETLNHADEAGAYALADRGTYLSMRDGLTLEIVLQGPIEGGPDRLANPYGLIAVNPAVHDHVEYDLAMAYIGYLTGPGAQAIIESFTIDGTQLFYPDATAANPNFEQYVPEGWESPNE
ncbi:substrate-binding domain-containing protein [Halovivax gelatinilyticus]|uniref:substrate-binding domain-containing protein n=1 Tax=Halovivax gelatinilyticus TaxID=2961597 RepID=UPI0020CA4B94|nr:substrate-binding domain-containing protein [Halovivax gelatinilyticus]